MKTNHLEKAEIPILSATKPKTGITARFFYRLVHDGYDILIITFSL
jgi:hypothetical protein